LAKPHLYITSQHFLHPLLLEPSQHEQRRLESPQFTWNWLCSSSVA
jgi:hypothetical protein